MKIDLGSLFGRWLAVLVLAAMLFAGACSPPTPTPKATETPAAAARLAFTTQPVGGTADTPLTAQPVVTVFDANGKVATGYRSILSLAITPGTGAADAKLIGGKTLEPANGEFRSSDIGIDRAGSGYTLTATSGTLSATSAPFNISPGRAAKLVFSVQPSGGTAGSPLRTQPQVIVLDRNDNAVTSYQGTVTVGITFGAVEGGAKLSGTTSASLANGVARFTNLAIEKAATGFTLTVMSEGLASATSDKFTISPGAPAKIGFSQEPRLARATRQFFIQPKVEVQDAYGNPVPGAKGTVTVAITPGTGAPGAVLSGNKTSTTGEFENLSIDLPGKGYTLTATSPGLASGISPVFDVGRADEPLGIFGQ